MSRPTLPLIPLLATLLLCSCGGGGGDSTAAMPPKRGDLIENPPTRVASYSPGDLLGLLAASPLSQAILDRILVPVCTVDVHQLKYRTVDPADALTPASGALMIPNGAAPQCRGSRPIVLYAHGTSTDRAFNIADVPNSGEGLLLAAVFAAAGYIVVAPNYVGYDTSTLTYHPYLNGDQQSKDMIDALSAARSALPTSTAADTTDSGKLFITGYSQGGYVAMATHRAMQALGEPVTASAPMSGPYTLVAFGDSIFEGQVGASGPMNMILLLSSYQHAYGDIYAQATDAFEARYADGIESLLPSTTPLSDLRAQGKLPADQVFSSTPPAAEFASMTPATSPSELAAVFAKGFGTENLLTNDFRLAYLQDTQSAPDGGFPTTTDGLPPANPVNPLRKALKANDLRNWTPTAPILLCAGNSDPTVFYLNTQLMQGYWASVAADAPVTVLDIDSAVGSNDAFASQKAGFSIAKDLVRADAVLSGASDGGDSAVLAAYHVDLVAPFCLSAVKSFFDAKL